jgi:hypothetical protein
MSTRPEAALTRSAPALRAVALGLAPRPRGHERAKLGELGAKLVELRFQMFGLLFQLCDKHGSVSRAPSGLLLGRAAVLASALSTRRSKATCRSRHELGFRTNLSTAFFRQLIAFFWTAPLKLDASRRAVHKVQSDRACRFLAPARVQSDEHPATSAPRGQGPEVRVQATSAKRAAIHETRRGKTRQG